MDEMKGKGKRGLLRVVFGRTAFFLLFIALQLAVLYWVYVWLDKRYQAWGYGSFAVISAILTIHILNEKQNASFKMAWLVPVLLFPVFGTLFYVFVQLQTETKIFARRIEQVKKKTDHYLDQDPDVCKRLELRSRSNSNLSHYMKESGGYPTWDRTNFKYFPLGDDFYEDVLQELQKAKRYIFIEYFIIAKGVMWDSIVKILEQKVKEGVEVRILYDGMNSFSNLPHDYPKELEAKGIHCRIFNPIRPAISTSQNNRDHRKILVIDGHTAYTGGVNLADEYINVASRFGYWKDTGIRLAGEAVWSMTVMFLEMWNYINHSSEDYKQFMPQVYQKEPFEGDGFVQPYGDTPLDHETVGENIYLNIINHAERYVYIFTPYLIIDNEMLVSLCNAAKRGVDVRIVTPGIPDKKMIFLLTQSHYEPLLKCGVKIYQYTPGFIHAKSFLCDDKIGTVGSINLDYRSLFLHFECGVFMYKTKALMQLKEDCMDTFAASEEMTLEFCRGQNVFIRIFQGMMRLFAPLL
mgnify:CR=1 FL=1